MLQLNVIEEYINFALERQTMEFFKNIALKKIILLLLTIKIP